MGKAIGNPTQWQDQRRTSIQVQEPMEYILELAFFFDALKKKDENKKWENMYMIFWFVNQFCYEA